METKEKAAHYLALSHIPGRVQLIVNPYLAGPVFEKVYEISLQYPRRLS